MRLRITDRILVAIAGLLLLAICAGIVAQLFFQVDLVSTAVKAFGSERPEIRWILIGMAAVMFLLGLYCLMMLFRHRKRKDKFILQRNESGDLAISLKALESMVRKCIDQHEEVTVQHLYLENRKDGLLILIRGSVAGGISIPLTVEAIQKQIRQYVTACSGVEIRGIRVQIESSGEDAKDAPFAITAPAAKPLLKEPETKQTSVWNGKTSSEPAMISEHQLPDHQPVSPAAEHAESAQTPPAGTQQPASGTQPMIPMEEEEDDDRPLHQRLFSTQAEPCIVPMAPETEPAPDEETGSADESRESEEPAVTESAEEITVTEETEAEAADASFDAGDEAAAPETVPLTAETGKTGEADPEFLASLSAFDRVVTGKKEVGEE